MSRTREAPPAFDPTALQRMVDQAIRDGRHGTTMMHVCQSCGKWTEVIWFVNEQGRRLCKTCAPPDRYAITPTRKNA
jgi:hypothetical protein